MARPMYEVITATDLNINADLMRRTETGWKPILMSSCGTTAPTGKAEVRITIVLVLEQ